MSSVKSLKVAVIGGSGRIGRAVVRELASRGHTVLNLDRRALADDPAKFIYTELKSRELLQPVLEGCDAVCHLAEITHSSAPYSPDYIYGHNTSVSSMVLQTCADLKVPRAIYTSSVQVYGCWDEPAVPPERLPFDEMLPLRPQNVYALSKVANERYAQFVAEKHGLSVAVFRLPWVISGEFRDGYVRWMDGEGDRPLDGFGTYLHVGDAARAYAQAVERPLPGCEAYHFTAAEIISVAPLAQRLEKMAGWPLPPSDWPAFKSPVLLNKAQRDLDWAPRFSALDEYARLTGRDPRTAPAA